MAELTPVEARVLDAIDLEGLLAFLDRLVAVRSLSGREEMAQRLMADAMADAGLDVDVWEIDLDELRRHPAFCEEIERTAALGVVGQAGGDGPSIILNGHVDVVGVGERDQWTVDPWRATVRDGKVFGRGTADMKGGLSCALFAVRAVRDAGVRLPGRVAVHSVVGEEDGGTGTLATIERGHLADAAVIMEPTHMRIAPVQAGALNFRLQVVGRSAHACMREEGVSAVDLIAPILTALAELEEDRNTRFREPLYAAYRIPFPISVGVLRAGDWPSSVPDRLEMEGRFGVAPGERVAEARREFETAVAACADDHPWLSDHPPVVHWWGGQFEPARIDEDAPVALALRAALAAATGETGALQGMTYGSDMRLLVNEGGVPTVMFGPGDVRRAHRPDECVSIAELEAATRALALTVVRWCGGSLLAGR